VTDRVFVSYSHHDASLVTPVVRLLRSTNDFVFQDSDSIKPGQKWREALGEAIEQANLVVVFWCLHSNESPEVEREYRSAIEAKKDVLPVLLDSTPIPSALGEFQWIDFRELGRERHPRPEARPAPQAASPTRWRWYGALASAAVLVLLVGASLWMLQGSAPQVSNALPPPTTVEPPVPDPAVPVPTPSVQEPPPAASPVAPLVPLWVLTLLVVVVLLAPFVFRKSKSAAQKRQAANRQDQVMAETLEEELRRRLGSRGGGAGD